MKTQRYSLHGHWLQNSTATGRLSMEDQFTVVVDNDEEEIVWNLVNENGDCESSDIIDAVQEENSVPHISLNALHALTLCNESQLGCPLTSTYPLQVTVANGNNIMTSKMCRIKWSLHGEDFVADMMILPLGGSEMVLGIQWLSTLDAGVISHSQSPFLSPIVMVKKKDGRWRMCVDYIQLKKHIIKDKFPISLIEELIYELCGSKVFSNLDLRTFKTGIVNNEASSTESKAYSPLTKLLSKNAFVWDKEAGQAFEHEAMMTAPILKLPNLEEDFMVEIDASGEGIGAVLQQHVNSDVQQRIMDSWSQDEEIQTLIAKLKDGKACPKHYSWSNNLLTRKGKLVVGNDSSLLGTLAFIGFYWYNTNYKTSINTIPFEVFYGQPPLPHITYVPGDSNVDVVDRSTSAREEAISLLKFHLGRSEVRMKNMADKKMSEREFILDDWVYVKLQPYRQISLRKRKHHKLSPKFYGPYQIIARIGKVAYRLSLPVNSLIYPVFHVSQLKTHKRDLPNTQQALLEADEDSVISDKPKVVLRRKKLKIGTQDAEYVLVQWVNGAREDATWELLTDMVSSYP
ncbi:reverse transcriptase [Tanacetum coccineum]